ncbi:Diaminohydroxyphosphoribosylaminopyrimidine deaminase [Planctomycetales bacterium 10988]|nr:Diaminohydroxyphosphoribosylaminopyrimidine deaminase [Planctomycetales bacterium 10988]
MQRALELAAEGQGWVEPNPMVGCVLVQGEEIVGEGYHERYGQAHAERNALKNAGEAARGATAYVTLEPCSHQGKTPPCTQGLLEAGVAKVIAAMRDPFPLVAGQGFKQLTEAGVEVTFGLLEEEARWLNAPYLKLLAKKRPFILAKWAMTLDGKIATRTGDSRWISGPASRQIVHQIRSRVDGVLVGSQTALKDDPQLNARLPATSEGTPKLPRLASRIVVDSQASLSLNSRLVQTVHEQPVLVAIGPQADPTKCAQLQAAGCELILCEAATHHERLLQLLDELGRRRMTNILVEGGGQILGMLHDLQEIDEVHLFLAPKILGGAQAPGPFAGIGLEWMKDAEMLDEIQVRMIEEDVYVVGRGVERGEKQGARGEI